MKGRFAAWGLIAAAAAAGGCASKTGPPSAGSPPAAAPTPAPPPAPVPASPVSLAEAAPLLMALEDRRAFDAQTLEKLATAGDPAVRARAALALGRIGDPRAAPGLARMLGDPSPEVRRAAAFASGILGERRLSPSLAALLEDPDASTAERAAWALGMLEDPQAEEALMAAVTAAATPERRAALLRGLWRFSSPAAVAAARPYAADPDPRVRAAAIYVLARRPREESLELLTAALEDPDGDSAALAARALGLLGKPESAAPLGAAVAGRRPPVAMNAMAALMAVFARAAPSPDTVPVLRERLLALSGDANPNLAVPALALLRFFADDREVFRKLWAQASSGRGRRAQVALQSLMAGLGPESVEIADSAIASEDPELRAAAAESLSDLGQDAAQPRRLRLAEDSELVVRLRALEGIRTADSARASRSLLETASRDADPNVRAAALEALSLADGEGALAAWRSALSASSGDAGPDFAIAAIAYAEKSPEDPEARALVEDAYRHPSALVSRLARRALVKTFRADPAVFPAREYATGRTPESYGEILASAARPRAARVETVRGVFTLRLDGGDAPLTVENFATLAVKGYFDGAPIHRVVPNFVVQDGDPTGTGSGGPGYEIRDELNPRPYARGTVGMALAGPDTGGSQWFVTQAPQPHLDGLYTVFGQIASGMDVVARIEQGDRILRITLVEGR